ncbi:low affinity immunoglobulin gamma Fc region receptor II-like isoform X1 [Lates japonicus]|nr:low affinity immunoglobulin gamma Fc region receptor II-like isoform X1 [Lates japonicus]
MEPRAFCFTLLTVMILLCKQDQRVVMMVMILCEHGQRVDATKVGVDTRALSSEATPWIVVTVLLVVLLFLVGLHHFGQTYWDRVLPCLSTLISRTDLPEDRTGASAADADRETYAAVTENRTDENELSSTPIYYTLGDDDTQLGASAADADKGTYAAVTKKRKKKGTPLET